MKNLPCSASLHRIHYRRLIALAFCAIQVWAQHTTPPPAAAAAIADWQWEDIQLLLTHPTSDGRNRSQTPVSVGQTRRKIAERFLRAADAARAFGENHPTHQKVREARLAEARGIMQAAMAGDVSREKHGQMLVEEVRRDPDLPARTRLELVALSEIVRLRPMLKSRQEFLAAHEQSVRNQIAEFPAEPGAYAALQRCAENHPTDAEGIRIARDLEALPAPENIKANARTFLERQALVGRSLPEIAQAALGENNPIGSIQDRGIILYSWAATQPDSVLFARNLVWNGPLNGPADARMIGINLDHDTGTARDAARAAGLPEEQIYDPRGPESPLAQALRLTRPGEVYVVTPGGILHSVSATRGNLTAKFRPVARPSSTNPAPLLPSPHGNPAKQAGKNKK